MGRELRRVPPDWEHPTKTKWNHRLGDYEEVFQPMFDRDVEQAFCDWLAGFEKWQAGERKQHVADNEGDYRSFCEWEGEPPDPEYFRPSWGEDEATWYQVYETVSEGTPVTPPFATREELVDYLVENGDFWDQRRRADKCDMPCAPWSREAATGFVFGSQWLPSGMLKNGVVYSGSELAEEMAKE